MKPFDWRSEPFESDAHRRRAYFARALNGLSPREARKMCAKVVLELDKIIDAEAVTTLLAEKP